MGGAEHWTGGRALHKPPVLQLFLEVRQRIGLQRKGQASRLLPRFGLGLETVGLLVRYLAGGPENL